MLLSLCNHHPRDTKITFKAEGHKYSVDGDPCDYTSVTTWLGAFFNKFDSDQVLARYHDGWQRNPKNKYYGKTKREIKDAWAKKGESACLLGTRLHETIERFYNMQTPEIPDPELGIELEAFKRFHQAYNPIPYRTEMIVYDERIKIAGSIDFLAKTDRGTYVIYDWKRSTQDLSDAPFGGKQCLPPFSHLPDTIFIKYALQLNCYRCLLEDLYNIPVEDCFLVQMHQEIGPEPNVVRVPDLRSEIRKAFQLRYPKN